MFVATLDGIFKYPDIPEEYEPYVQFKATIEKREVKDGDDLAILSISGTDSHHVLFLDSYNNIREIEKELKDGDTEIYLNDLSGFEKSNFVASWSKTGLIFWNYKDNIILQIAAILCAVSGRGPLRGKSTLFSADCRNVSVKKVIFVLK